MNNFGILCLIALYGASYTAVDGASRILGGSAVNNNQFRYMVSLQRLSEVTQLTRGHRCGGALISFSRAVTAASCLYDNNAGTFSLITPAQYRLFAGATRLNDDSFPERIERISSFTVHPQFVPTQRFINDIAVITTARPYSAFVVMTLAVPIADINIAELGVSISTGWGGQNASASASYQLMFTENRVTENADCNTAYNQLGTPISMQPSMVCAMPLINTSGCQGDLGNPLVYDSNLLGVLFLSKDCATPTLEPTPDVYTKVFTHRNWLNEVLNSPLPSGASTYQSGIGLVAIFAVVQVVATMS
uniref:Peptidase S1 domain-containing protein n=1 Tax=Heliothis virescens TaxID=7102 RepID=A0A2A4J4Y6_HELVI